MSDDIEAMKRRAYEQLFGYDAQADQASESDTPDYRTAYDEDSGPVPIEQTPVIAGELSNDTRLTNLESRMTSVNVRFEVMAEYCKKLERDIQQLQHASNQHSGALGLHSVEMGQ